MLAATAIAGGGYGHAAESFTLSNAERIDESADKLEDVRYRRRRNKHSPINQRQIRKSRRRAHAAGAKNAFR